MPASRRDLTIIINARDNASVKIDQVAKSLNRMGDSGYKLLRVGAVMGLAGGAMIAAATGIAHSLMGATQAAADFDSQIRRAATQVDIAGETMDSVIPKLGASVKNVASQIGIPIAQLTDGMFEILSTVKATIPQAEAILGTLARAAVAGGTELNTMIRAVLGTMNGMNIPMEKMTDVLDTFIQIVRKGGSLTLEEFTHVIGRSLPTMAQYKQDIKEVGILMSFLTKNAVPAANAAVSMARATEAIFNPKAVGRLKQMGIEVENLNTRQLRPVHEILLDIGDAARKLPPIEQIKLLTELVKGAGGNVQARRLINLAVVDPEGLKEAIADMEKAGGIFEKTYAIMAKAPSNQIQLFRNNLELLRIEAGSQFLPLLAPLVNGMRAVTHWFANLSDQTKKTITAIITGIAIFTALVGIMALVVGGILTLVAVIGFVATTIATGGAAAIFLIGAFAGLALGVVALGGYIFSLAKNFTSWRDTVRTVAEDVSNVLAKVIDVFAAFVRGMLRGIKVIGEAWYAMWAGFDQIMADAIEHLPGPVVEFLFPGATKKETIEGLRYQVTAAMQSFTQFTTDFDAAIKTIDEAEVAAKEFFKKLPDEAVKAFDEAAVTIESVKAQYEAFKSQVEKAPEEAGTGLAPDFDEKKADDTIAKVRQFVNRVVTVMGEEIDRHIKTIQDNAAIMFDLAAGPLYDQFRETGQSLGEAIVQNMADRIREASPDVADALEDLRQKMEDFRHDLRSSGINSLKFFPDRVEEGEQLVRDSAYTLDQLVASLKEGYTKAADETSKGAKKLRAVTKAEMMQQAQEQLAATYQWTQALGALQTRLGPDGIRMLGEMGLLAPEMQPYLAALNTMTDAELKTWVETVGSNLSMIDTMATATTQTAFGGMVDTIRNSLMPAMAEWEGTMQPAIAGLTTMKTKVDELAASLATLTDEQITALFKSGAFGGMVDYLQGRQTGGAAAGTLGGTYNGRPIGDVFGGEIHLHFDSGTNKETVDYAANTFVEVVRTLQSS